MAQILAGIPAFRGVFGNEEVSEEAESLRNDISGVQRALLVQKLMAYSQVGSLSLGNISG